MDAAIAAAMTQLTQQVESLQSQLAALTLQQATATPEPVGGDESPLVRLGRIAIDARQLNKLDVFHGKTERGETGKLCYGRMRR